MVQSGRQVSPLDGRLRMLHDIAGLTLGAFGTFGVWGFEMFDDIKPSPFELTTAEKLMRLDLVPGVLWMDDCYSSLYTI
jgi:hypothetical protein